jgi:hypothetical protein
VSARSVRRPLEPWLDHSGTAATAAAEIRERLDAELTATAGPTGLRPERDEGGLSVTQTFAALIASRSTRR